jgi:hypothetical protein
MRNKHTLRIVHAGVVFSAEPLALLEPNLTFFDASDGILIASHTSKTE